MRYTKSVTTLFILFINGLVFAQQPDCGVGNPLPGNTCAEAPLICNLDGYCGTTSASYTADYWGTAGGFFSSGTGLLGGYTSGSGGGGCGSGATIENNSFLSFIAADANVSLDIWIGNCTNAAWMSGIQVYIFELQDICGQGNTTNIYCESQFSPTTAGSETISLTGLTPGSTYYIMIDGFEGDICDYTITAETGVSTGITADIDQNSTLCAGSSVTVEASGATGNYTWSGDAGLSAATGSTVTITPPSTPGTYSYLISSGVASICASADEYAFTITVEAAVTPTFTNAGPICSGTVFTLPTTSDNSETGTWSPAADNTATTTYTFTPDNTGCVSTSTMTVVVDNQITPTFTNPGPVCTGTAFTLPTTSNNNETGTWSPAIDNTTTTTYTFTPDNTGCVTIETMTVVVDNQITPTFTNPGPVCIGTAFTLPAISTNGATGTWSPASDNTSTTTYTFTPDNAACVSTETMTVVVDNQITPTFTNPGPICSGTAFTLPTTSTNGATGIWSPAIDNTTTTTYTFTPDNSGCVSTETMTVVIDNSITPTFTNPGPICSGTVFTLPTTSNNGETGTWSPAIDNTSTTTYTFTPDNAGCVSTETITVVVNNQITPTFTNPGPVCSGTAFTLPTTSNNGETGTWSPAIDNTSTTTYTFTPDNAACVSTETMTVAINNSFQINLSNGPSICPDDILTPIIITPVGGSAPYSFTYSIDNMSPMTISTNSSSAVIDLDNYPGLNSETSGCYDITIGGNDANSCVVLDNTYVDHFCINPNPIASFTLSEGNEGIYSTLNTSIGATNYQWNFNDGSNSEFTDEISHQFPNDEPGNYTIELIAYSADGCEDKTSQTIQVKEDLIFYVPNAFTPDGDSYNPTFHPVMTSGFDADSYQMQIFNRWGELIFTSNDITNGWDGTYKGKPTQDGTFVWKIQFKMEHNDEKKEYLGHLNLLR